MVYYDAVVHCGMMSNYVTKQQICNVIDEDNVYIQFYMIVKY